MKNSLKKKYEFNAARKGKKIHTANFVYYVTADPDGKLGVVIPGKHGNAVTRNTARRVARELFTNVGYTVLVYSKGKLVCDTAAFRAEMAKVAKNVHR